MIPANELRIGNIVGMRLEKYPTNYFIVLEIGETMKLKECRRVSGDVGFWDIGDCQPVELTPEILEKCGFKAGKVKGVARLVDDIDDIDPADKQKYTYYWDLKVPKNNHVEDLSAFNLVQFGKGTDILWAHQWLRVKVKHLHQLQNLYFALTGNELKIEL
jgi:hypothetical protein